MSVRPQSDSLTRFLFENDQIRGSIVRLNQTWQHIQTADNYPDPVRGLLGEALAATALLGRNLKFDGRLGLQLQGGEHLRLLVLQCDNQLRLRGLARFGDDPPETFGRLVEGATLCVSIEASKKHKRYQSIVPLSEADFATCLEHYYRQSVQLPTLFLLAVDDMQASGIMLQALPERQAGSGRWQQLQQELEGLDVGRMCRVDDLTLLSALFPEDDIRLFEPEPVAFHCDCSIERIEKMLCMLAESELRELVAEHDPVEVRCEFCNRAYEIPGETVLKLAAEMKASGSGLH